MDENTAMIDQTDLYAYDDADKPFDFIEEEVETALICELNPELTEKIKTAMTALGYLITEAVSTKDALKKMRFHTFDVIVLDERFDAPSPEENNILKYLENLNMTTRRNIFVALVTEKFRSMDNMAAFNNSVNLVVNTKNIADIETILKRGAAENRAFYRVFKDSMKKMGKV